MNRRIRRSYGLTRREREIMDVLYKLEKATVAGVLGEPESTCTCTLTPGLNVVASDASCVQREDKPLAIALYQERLSIPVGVTDKKIGQNASLGGSGVVLNLRVLTRGSRSSVVAHSRGISRQLVLTSKALFFSASGKDEGKSTLAVGMAAFT